jgi:hypothetical protein
MLTSFELPMFEAVKVIGGKFHLPPSNYLRSLLEVRLIQRSDPELVPLEKLNFTFSFEWVNTTASNINVRFFNPAYISYG